MGWMGHDSIMQPEQYTEFDMETVQRLTEVETRLKHVETSLDKFRTSNDIRLLEIKNLIVAGRPKPALPIVLGFVSRNWKWLVVVIGLVTGVPVAKLLGLLGGI